MQISNPFKTGVEGIKSGIENARQAAQDIASGAAEQANQLETPVTTKQAEFNGQKTSALNETPSEDFSAALLQQAQAQTEVAASAKVVKAEDARLGTLVDIQV